MRKRKPSDSDSLELLLDTICNMFGCVLFIAMLLAIFAGAKGEGISQSAGISSVAEASEMKARIERLEREVATYESTASTIRSESKSDINRIGELSARLAGDYESAQERLEESLKLLESIDARNADLSSQTDSAEQTLKELTKSNTRLKEMIARERDSKMSDARLPVTRQTGKLPLHLILKGGKIHQLFVIQPNGSPALNSTDVTVEEFTSFKRFTPLANGGFRVTSSLSQHPRWHGLVSSCSPEDFFLYLLVYPDSFDVFRAVRAAGAQAGFEYNLIINSMEDTVDMVPSKDFTTQ